MKITFTITFVVLNSDNNILIDYLKKIGSISCVCKCQKSTINSYDQFHAFLHADVTFKQS